MIAIDLGRALDPALIGADCGLVLDPWQVALMREQHPRILMCCSRQARDRRLDRAAIRPPDHRENWHRQELARLRAWTQGVP